MISTPEEVISEVAHETVAYRGYLAEQLRNKFHPGEPVAKVLEESASNKLLAIQYKETEEGNFANAMENGQLDEMLRDYCSPEKVNGLKDSSRMPKPGEEWPAGMKSLHKKINHAEARRKKGEEILTVFESFSSLKFARATVADVQGLAEGLIEEIMLSPSTIIDRGRTIDFFNMSGIGLRANKEPFLFVGFIDPRFYTKPDTRAKLDKLHTKGGVAA